MSTYTKTVRPRVVGEDPECAQHHKVQTMDPNRVAVKHVWETMTNILRKLIRHPYAHLTDEDLKHLKIKCTGLDFNTGMPADGSEVFIRPIPINRTHEILERSSPWLKHRPLLKSWNDTLSDATDIVLTLALYLHAGEDEPSLLEETEWSTRQMDYSEGERLTRCPPYGADTEWTEWTVYTILDKMVDSAPHVTCLLADDATLIDAQLSNAEIWCILAVTNRRIQLPEYLKHRIIPVTIISAADQKVRIVQGYVDGGEGCLRVRKSPILDIRDDPLRQMELVLSWCVGDTVGRTEH